MYSIICLPKIINTLINFNSKFIFKKCLNNVTINNLKSIAIYRLFEYHKCIMISPDSSVGRAVD